MGDQQLKAKQFGMSPFGLVAAQVTRAILGEKQVAKTHSQKPPVDHYYGDDVYLGVGGCSFSPDRLWQ